MRKMDRFFEDLSNWYIRRNRRRFWKSVDDQDKLAAYQTLYDVLFNTIKLLAPMVPFITEEIYQNLVKNADQNAAESVHLCDYPAVNDDYIDESLMRRVDTLKKLVELGRSARNKANLKIRQPLSSLKFVVKSDDSAEFILDQKSVVLDELNVKSIERFDSPEMLINFHVKPNLKILGQKYGENLQIIRKFINEKGSDYILNELESGGELKVISGSDSCILTREDLLIEPKPVEGFTSATDEGLTVGLLTELNDELVQEGVIRDFIRQVQIMRKEASFAVEDRIEIFGKIEGKCGKALEVFKEYFYNETLTVNMNNKNTL
jgi:isoleucyl-tRNA synthetase